MKIANKIGLGFFILTFILTTIGVGTFYIVARKDLQNAIYNHLTTAVVSRTKHIETLLELKEESTAVLAQSVAFRILLTAGEKDADYAFKFNQALTRIKATQHELAKHIYEIFLLDRRGKVIISNDEDKIGVDWSNDACFLDGSKATYIEDAYYSETMGRNSIGIASPIKDNQSGEVLGVVVLKVSLDALNKITTDRTGLGKTGEIYVVNKYGYMITPSRFIKDTFLKQKVDTENAKRVLLHKTEEHVLHLNSLISVFSNYRGVQVLGTHGYISKMHWEVLAEIETKEAFAPLFRLWLFFLGGIIMISLIAWLIGTYIGKFITGPLFILHKGTEIIGSGNLDYKVGTDTKDEVGQLSRAFDKMTNSLKKSTTSIENLNKEIIERRKAEEDLKQAYEKLKTMQFQLVQCSKMAAVGQLAGGVAHEINNPLTGVLNNVQLVKMIAEQKKDFNLDEFKELLNIIEESAQRCTRIIRSLLNFSRASKGTFQPLSLNELIDKVVILIEHEMKLQNILIERHLEPDLPLY